jgi:hypothetical protein
MTHEAIDNEILVKELKKCRDLLDKLNMEIGTFTSMDIERDLGDGYLDEVSAAVDSIDNLLGEPGDDP